MSSLGAQVILLVLLCSGSYDTHGWMDELRFYIPFIVFQSFRADRRMNVKGSMQ